MDSKEQKTEQSPVVTTVTRAKHPGRVAQGKKLAAMMKERKEALVKNKDSELVKNKDSELVSAPSGAAGDHVGSAMSNFGLYGGIALLVAGGIYYLYARRKSPAQATPEPPKKMPKKYMD